MPFIEFSKFANLITWKKFIGVEHGRLCPVVTKQVMCSWEIAHDRQVCSVVRVISQTLQRKKIHTKNLLRLLNNDNQKNPKD